MGRPRNNTANPEKPVAKKRGRKPKASAEALVVEEVIAETPVAVEEPKAENASEEVVVETVAEEVKPEEEVKSAEESDVVAVEEPKPKRKYTKRAKTVEETPVVTEEEPKPKRKYTKREKPVEVPEEVKTENTSAPKLEVYIQGAGAERSFEELSETAVRLSGVKSPKSVNLYIKPYEDDGIAKVYYVVDKKAGHFNLFN